MTEQLRLDWAGSQLYATAARLCLNICMSICPPYLPLTCCIPRAERELMLIKLRAPRLGRQSTLCYIRSALASGCT
jgi:hypothetical protein